MVVGTTAVIALIAFTFSLLPSLPDEETIKDVHLSVPLRVYANTGELLAEFGEERREPVEINQVPEPLIQAILAAEDDGFYSHPGVDFVGVIRAAMTNLSSGQHEQGASTITMQVARNYFLSREKTYTRKIKEALLAFRIERMLSKDQILELYVNKIFLGHRAYGFAAAARVYYGKTLEELSIPEVAMLAGLPKAPSRDNPLTNPERAMQRRNYVLSRMHQLNYFNETAYNEFKKSPLTAERHQIETDVEAPYVAEMVRDYMLEKYGEEAYWRGYKVYTTVVPHLQHRANRAIRKGLLQYSKRHGYLGAASSISLEQNTDAQILENALSNFPISRNMLPAVVVAVQEKTATAYAKNKQLIEIPWDGLSWAKKFKTAEQQGSSPKQASDVVAPGDIVYVTLDDEQNWRLTQLPEISGGLVSLNPNDGAILSLTGGFDFYLSKFNRIIQAQRQPGSNIKPFIYSAALENDFTPASLVSGGPIVINDVSQESIWRPENYSGKFFGPTRLRKALSLSLNLVSVRILRAIGLENARRHLQRFGFDPDSLPNGLSLALGSGTVPPITVARAYAVLANGGYMIEPYFIRWVEDSEGNIIEQTKPYAVCSHCAFDSSVWSADKKQAPRVISPENHFLITNMMQDVIKQGTGRRALKLGRGDLAGKTGTTNDFKDAWFSGFNQDVVTTVWVGFDDSRTLGKGEAGSKAALPIWVDYMEEGLKGVPERELSAPDSIVAVRVSSESGEAVTEQVPGYTEYFKIGTQPELKTGFRPTIDTQPNSESNSSTEGLF